MLRRVVKGFPASGALEEQAGHTLLHHVLQQMGHQAFAQQASARGRMASQSAGCDAERAFFAQLRKTAERHARSLIFTPAAIQTIVDQAMRLPAPLQASLHEALVQEAVHDLVLFVRTAMLLMPLVARLDMPVRESTLHLLSVIGLQRDPTQRCTPGSPLWFLLARMQTLAKFLELHHLQTNTECKASSASHRRYLVQLRDLIVKLPATELGDVAAPLDQCVRVARVPGADYTLFVLLDAVDEQAAAAERRQQASDALRALWSPTPPPSPSCTCSRTCTSRTS